jgi:hypothetical protein
VSGRGGSGNFGSGRTHRRARADRPLAGWVGMPSGTDITLAGSHCRDPPAIVSQAGLHCPSVPAPRTRYEVRASLSVGRVFISAIATSKHPPPPPSARNGVRGRACGAISQAGLLSLRLGGNIWESCFLGILGIQFSGSSESCRCMLGRAWCVRGKVCRAYLLWSLVILRQVGTILPLVAPAAAAAAAGQPQQQQQRSTARTGRARSKLVVPRRRRRSAHQVRGRSREHAVLHVQDQLVANSAVQ